MATASTAGAWQGGGRPERPYPARAPRPPVGNDRPVRPVRPSRPVAPAPGRAGERLRAAEREYADDRFDGAEPSRPRRREPVPPRPAGRPAQERDRARAASPSSAPESRLRGSLAVLGIFLITLAGGALDSFIGIGLGLVTLVALAVGVSAATLLVRRRDLLTVVVAPPLVFTLVALVNIALAPSATLNLPTLATLLVRGFPTMAVATAIAVLLGIVRLVTRR